MEYVTQKKTSQEESISKGLKVSFILHALLFSSFFLKSVFFTHEEIDYQAAVRVDLVGLPDKIEPTQMPEKPKEIAKPEPSPVPPTPKPVEKKVEKPVEKPVQVVKKQPDTINLEKQKSKEKAAMEKLKAMEALDKIKDDVAKDQQQKKAAAAPKLKGNTVSPGTALSGLSKLQHDTYVADLDAHIKKNWALPEWLAKKDYKAQVRVRIDEKGSVISRQIIKSSGNQSYDEEVLATVDRSAPFPPPPEKFVSIVEVDGILIGFPE